MNNRATKLNNSIWLKALSLVFSLLFVVFISCSDAQAAIFTKAGVGIPNAANGSTSEGFRILFPNAAFSQSGLLINSGNVSADGNGGGLILLDSKAATNDGKLLYLSLINNGGKLYVYEGFNQGEHLGVKRILTEDDATGGGGGSSITDTDSDTFIDTELSADEDFIRMVANGNSSLIIDKNGLGIGRQYTAQDNKPCPNWPNSLPLNQPYNCCADTNQLFNYYNHVDSKAQGELLPRLTVPGGGKAMNGGDPQAYNL